MNIAQLIHWYSEEKRFLPWRKTHDPYKVWVSEIFLQQTQVSRVIDFYTRFLEKFPTVFDLANASWEEFLPYFQGLGFYSRGRNMLKTAQKIVSEYNGIFPNDTKSLQNLPGIGAYTAAAICSFAYQQNIPALDVNLFRVMGRYWGLENQKEITKKAQELYAQTPHGDLLNHAFMDLGSSLCLAKTVKCTECPLKNTCHFYISEKIIEKDLSPKAPLQKYEEYSVLVLRHEGKILLEQKSEYFGFPLFYNAQKQDHRHFLQAKAREKWNIIISVRPPFFTIIENGKRFRISRCQILEGIPPKGIWEIPKNTNDISFEPLYSDGFLEKWRAMIP